MNVNIRNGRIRTTDQFDFYCKTSGLVFEEVNPHHRFTYSESAVYAEESFTQESRYSEMLITFEKSRENGPISRESDELKYLNDFSRDITTISIFHQALDLTRTSLRFIMEEDLSISTHP